MDKFGQKGDASLTQRIKSPYKDVGPPYAAVTSNPKQSTVDEPVEFDASKSHDANNKPCQLSSHTNQVINSLRNSKFLSLTSDSEWIGRIGFQTPIEKQFPFRRTSYSSNLWLTEMLSPFGKLSKIKFDHGPDTLDPLVSENI